MPMNGYASLVRKRADTPAPTGKRRKLDDYETPADTTRILCEHYPALKGNVLEPACGSGRMVKALKEFYGSKIKVTATDLKSGHDFLKREKTFAGHIITNPPYRDGLADAFVFHALGLADGRVCLLMESGYLWGGRRAARLYNECKPEAVIVLPERVYFYAGGKPIPSQFYKHAWLVWPDRKTRMRGGYETKTFWPDVRGGF